MKDKKYWKKLIALLFGGWLTIWVYRSMLSPIYAEIQQTIGLQSNAALGLIASCYFFGYTIMQIPSGLLVKKYGQKKIIIPGFTVFAVGTLITTVSKSIGLLYFGNVLAGIGCGTYYGAAFSLTAKNVPLERKGTSAAIVNSGCAAGLIVGLTGSSFFVKSLNYPWQLMGLFTLILIMGMIVLFFFIIKNSDSDIKEIKAREVREEPSTRTLNLLSPDMISCYILYFSTCYVYYLIITWLPEFLSTERNIQNGLLGIVSAMISVTAVPGGLFFARLSDKKRKKKPSIIIFLELSSVVLVILSMLASNLFILIVILLLYGFLGKIAVDPVMISFLSDKTDGKNLPLALGVFNCCGMSASVIAPIITGFIIDQTGSGEGGFYIGAVILAIGTLCFIYLNKHKN